MYPLSEGLQKVPDAALFLLHPRLPPLLPSVTRHHSHLPSPGHRDGMEYWTRNDHPKPIYACPEGPRPPRCSLARRGDMDLSVKHTHCFSRKCVYLGWLWGAGGNEEAHCSLDTVTVATPPSWLAPSSWEGVGGYLHGWEREGGRRGGWGEGYYYHESWSRWDALSGETSWL